MKTTFEYIDIDEAIAKLKKMKRENRKKKIRICTVDFDNNVEFQKMSTHDEGCQLMNMSKTIIFNDDTFFPHIELYSRIQDINNIRAVGIMHDIFL